MLNQDERKNDLSLLARTDAGWFAHPPVHVTPLTTLRQECQYLVSAREVGLPDLVVASAAAALAKRPGDVDQPEQLVQALYRRRRVQ